MFDLQPWQWALAIVATFLVGISKTGIAGVGVLTVAMFATVFPPLLSTGVLLPLLICADVVAVIAYQRHAVWKHLWQLFPWVVAGIVAGFFLMGHINDAQMRRWIGGILVAMVAVHFWRQQKLARDANRMAEAIPHAWWFIAVTGFLSGLATMIANAAGPLMILYMLALGLPKMEFLGTGAWYFLILNVFKVPFSMQLGLVNGPSLKFDLLMAPVAIAGALFGRAIAPHINQKLFETLALGFTLIAALRLLFQ